MDEKSDFDFFIVCAPQRIWISRMLLVLYKKLFLRNSHRYFCINYFIDESDLEIDEKNIFTATELGTVIPLTGSVYYERLMEINKQWLLSKFPNFERRISIFAERKNSLIKRFAEAAISLFYADGLNRLFKTITLNRWRKTYRHLYSAADFQLAFKSTNTVSKNHPRNFQKRIITEFDMRVSRLTTNAEVYE